MSRKEEVKISKHLVDLINEYSKKIGVEHIFNLLEYLASLSFEQIITEAKKDNFTITLEQANELSRQTRAIVNLILVDD